jgi:hypothetical protein
MKIWIKLWLTICASTLLTACVIGSEIKGSASLIIE